MRIISILSTAILLGGASAVAAQDHTDELSAALEKYHAGDRDGALRQLELLLTADDADKPTKERLRELTARLLLSRGEEHFRQARVAEAIADFDRQLQLQPEQSAEHWQRGIACYYAGQYEKGARQFELHQTVNPQDVENAAWHFLCVARAPGGSVQAARARLIPVASDSRVPMAQIQKLFAGDMTPEEVLQAGEGGGTARFYADLYVGLYYEALNRNDESMRLIAQAADNPAARDSYMGDVARVHVRLRKQPKPLASAHAHNDYLHERPLLDALDHGFASVEADIFLVDGRLLVGHERETLEPDRTLESLYLTPLANRVKQNGGRVHPGGDRFFLLIDIKSDPESTYACLAKALAAHADMLTTVEGDFVKKGAVTVVITGNRPIDELLKGNRWHAGLDGRLADLDSDTPAYFMPMISDRWSAHFTWTGHGPMPPAEQAKLKEIVNKAHAAGRVVRFWATPENESLWTQLRSSGVDLINTDQLDRLAAFLAKELP